MITVWVMFSSGLAGSRCRGFSAIPYREPLSPLVFLWTNGPSRLAGVNISETEAFYVLALALFVVLAAVEVRWRPADKAFSFLSPERRRQLKQQIPIGDVLDIIVEHYRPDWGEPAYVNAKAPLAANILREVASKGEIIIEGRRELQPAHAAVDQFRQIWEPIPAEYWSNHEFDLAVVLDETAPLQASETMPDNPSDTEAAEQPSYAGLRVSKREALTFGKR